MNFIKDAKDLIPNDQLPYDDEKVGKRLAESIQYYVNKDWNSMNVYRKKIPADYSDWEYEYIKRHKKELKEKGYKIRFNFSSLVAWPQVSYTIKWRGGKR